MKVIGDKSLYKITELIFVLISLFFPKSEYESNRREIGRGKFAVVYEVVQRKTRQKFAAKHIK